MPKQRGLGGFVDNAHQIRLPPSNNALWVLDMGQEWQIGVLGDLQHRMTVTDGRYSHEEVDETEG